MDILPHHAQDRGQELENVPPLDPTLVADSAGKVQTSVRPPCPYSGDGGDGSGEGGDGGDGKGLGRTGSGSAISAEAALLVYCPDSPKIQTSLKLWAGCRRRKQ